MARIAYPGLGEMSEQTRALLARIPPANVFRMMGHMDRIASPLVKLGSELLYQGSLDPILRELVIVRVGHLSAAPYEIAQHEAIARQLGVDEKTLAALRPGGNSSALTSEQSAVLDFSDQVVKQVRVSDAGFAAVSEYLSDGQICELVVCIGYYMMISRFLEVFRIDGESEQMLTDLPASTVKGGRE